MSFDTKSRPRAPRAIHAMMAALAALAVGSPGSLAAAAPPAPGTVRVGWNDGARKIVYDVALDEVEIATPAAAPVPPDAPAVAVRARLASPAAALADLDDAAAPALAAARRTGSPGAASPVLRAVAYAPGAPHESRRAVTIAPEIVVGLAAGTDAAAVAKLASARGFRVERTVATPGAKAVVLVPASGPAGGTIAETLAAVQSLSGDAGVAYAVPVTRRQATRRSIAAPNDNLFGIQWHLLNTGTNVPGAFAGNDANVSPAWAQGVTGLGVNIGIVDDGLQQDHPDLAPNVRADLALDINYGDNDPTPLPTDPNGAYNVDDHGTACAGVAAARGDNGLGVTGAAQRAGLVGIRIISAGATDEQEALALSLHADEPRSSDTVHIYSNSWGPSDDGATLEGPGPLLRAAFAANTDRARVGRGSLYIWAGGNGLQSFDDSNYDGYANSRETIAVAAMYADGTQSYYSEPGANLTVTAPSSGVTTETSTNYGIVTSDRTGAQGYDASDYTNNSTTAFGGTSSACPLVAGCVALMLEANPDLQWRDVQQILARTAAKNDATDTGWANNGAGLHFNHKYGFGRVDAAAAVDLARRWQPLMPRRVIVAGATTPVAIPDNTPAGVTQSVVVANPAGIRVERVQFSVQATHTYRGDLKWILTSPSGTKSVVESRDDATDNYDNWTFSSVAPLGENPAGTWTLNVADLFANDTGTLTSWTLAIHGSAPNPLQSSNGAFNVAGWTATGVVAGQATADYDSAAGALRATVTAGATNRVAGWRAAAANELLPFSAIGPDAWVRARFAIYASGQAGSNSNEIPNFRIRAASRFAATSILDVFHHNSADPEADRLGRDFRPSASDMAPSVYMVDFAPIAVPGLFTPGTTEGVARAFETYSLASEPQENGSLSMVESTITAYPALTPTTSTDILRRVYAAPGDFTNNAVSQAFKYRTTDLALLAAAQNNTTPITVGGVPLPLVTAAEASASFGSPGISLSTAGSTDAAALMVLTADLTGGAAGDLADRGLRARMEPGKQYAIRFHATSTAPAATNAMVRFRARAVKFAWTQRLEVGGSYAAGATNNGLARAMLPGVGSQNPDQRVPGEAGGWYTVMMHTPLDPLIRGEAAPGTPLSTSMPALGAQAGTGVNTPSRRDILLGVDILDTLSTLNGTVGAELEQGQVDVDRIEIRQYNTVVD